MWSLRLCMVSQATGRASMMCWVSAVCESQVRACSMHARMQAHEACPRDPYCCLLLTLALLSADYLSNNKIDNTVVLTGDIHTHWVRSLLRIPYIRRARRQHGSLKRSSCAELTVTPVPAGLRAAQVPMQERAGLQHVIPLCRHRCVGAVKHMRTMMTALSLLLCQPTMLPTVGCIFSCPVAHTIDPH